MHPVFQVIIPALILMGLVGGRVIVVQVLRARRPALPDTRRLALGAMDELEPELRRLVEQGRVLVSQIRLFIVDVERLELFGAGHRALAPGQRLRFRPSELLERTEAWASDIDAVEGDGRRRLEQVGYATTGIHEVLARAASASWMNTNCTNSADELDQAIRFFGELTSRVNGLERALDVSELPVYRDPSDRAPSA